MTVSELIAWLNNIKDKNKKVIIDYTDEFYIEETETSIDISSGIML